MCLSTGRATQLKPMRLSHGTITAPATTARDLKYSDTFAISSTTIAAVSAMTVALPDSCRSGGMLSRVRASSGKNTQRRQSWGIASIRFGCALIASPSFVAGGSRPRAPRHADRQAEPAHDEQPRPFHVAAPRAADLLGP